MDLDRINELREERQRQAERKQDQDILKQAADKLDKSIKHQTAKSTAERKNTTYKVKSVEPLATPKDIQKVVDAIEDVVVSQAATADDVTDALKDMSAGLLVVADEMAAMPKQFPKIPEFPKFPDFPETTKVENLEEIKPWLEQVTEAIKQIEVSPVVDVKQPDVNVTQAKVDITPITKALAKVEAALKSIKMPETNLSELIKATRGTTKAINSLTFPVPNYVLPFKDSDGKATQVSLNSSGKVPVDNAIGTSNIASGQVTVAATATLIAAARTNRRSIAIISNDITDVFIGESDVTASTGALLLGVKGGSITLDTAAAIYGITSSGTSDVTYLEIY